MLRTAQGQAGRPRFDLSDVHSRSDVGIRGININPVPSCNTLVNPTHNANGTGLEPMKSLAQINCQTRYPVPSDHESR